MSARAVRSLTDETTAAELFGWHAADSPTCTEPGLSWRTDGYGCRTCGWLAIDRGAEPPRRRLLP